MSEVAVPNKQNQKLQIHMQMNQILLCMLIMQKHVNRNDLVKNCVVFIPASSYLISHEILIQITRYISVTFCHTCFDIAKQGLKTKLKINKYLH